MSAPSRRRILVRAPGSSAVRDRVGAYAELYPGGPDAYAIRVAEPMGGWVQVEIPPELPLVHFHNLAKWLEGDAEDPGTDDVVTISHGDAPWEYWLVPCKDERADWFLTGADGEGRPFQWDCIAQKAVDDPRLQRAPMGTRLALMTRKVHAGLHRPDAAPKPFAEVTLHLDAPEPRELVMPEPGDLATTFERTPDPNADKGGMEQVLEWIGGFFSPKK